MRVCAPFAPAFINYELRRKAAIAFAKHAQLHQYHSPVELLEIVARRPWRVDFDTIYFRNEGPALFSDDMYVGWVSGARVTRKLHDFNQT